MLDAIIYAFVQAKKAIQEQLELSRKLTEKQQVQSESDDEKGQ